MRTLTLAIIGLSLVVLLGGCSALEQIGVIKTPPAVYSGRVDRESSTAIVEFSRSSVPTKLAVWSVDQSQPDGRRYLEVKFNLIETIDRGGRAYFLLTGHNGQALDLNKVYFLLVEVRGTSWDYDAYDNYCHNHGGADGYDFNADSSMTDSPASKLFRDDPNTGVTEVRSVAPDG